MKIPEVGQYIKFKTKHNFCDLMDTYVEIEENSLAKIVQIDYQKHSFESFYIVLTLATYINSNPLAFTFNFTVHHKKVDILPDGKATKLLYEKTEQV